VSYAHRPMGDYKTYGYAGDPGFLSGAWKVAQKYGKPILAGIFGGVAGEVLAPSRRAGTPPILPSPPPGTVGGAISFPGGTRVSGAVVPRLGGAAALGACPTGYHYAKDGSGRLVRNRRMNVANPRALRKAMRRVQGFEKLAKRTIQFTRRVKMKTRKSS